MRQIAKYMGHESNLAIHSTIDSFTSFHYFFLFIIILVLYYLFSFLLNADSNSHFFLHSVEIVTSQKRN